MDAHAPYQRTTPRERRRQSRGVSPGPSCSGLCRNLLSYLKFGTFFALARSGRSEKTPGAVGAYIGAAYFFTSSTSFANPASAVGRMFSNSFAGIAPSSVPGFIGAELIGGGVAIAIIHFLYPNFTATSAQSVTIAHESFEEEP